LPRGSNAIGEEPREIAGSRGHVEHAVSRSHAGELHREALPVTMHADRHEIVHEVVLAGDRVEHAAHAPRLFFGRNLLVAEVRLVAHVAQAPARLERWAQC